MILQLAMQSAGAGIGVFLGTVIGLSMRRDKSRTSGLLGGSVVLTALAAGLLAMAVMMVIKYFTAW
ncbi:hypothetical protein [Salipiger sp.]|uniref:hypothetical protein n=1 Tax=Salipiger sp. TaxID=2078585 RepID=UPI003A97A54A